MKSNSERTTSETSDGAHDVEKVPQNTVIETDNENIAELQHRISILGRLRKFELWLDKKLKIEPMGVERLSEEARRPPSILNTMLLWFSNLISPALAAVGGIGPLIGISIADSTTVMVLGTLIGSFLPAMTATLSPQTGLRQIAVSRFAFGISGAKLCAFLNILLNVGYAVIGAIWSGQLLRAVSGGSMDITVGIVITTLLAFVLAFLGFRIIHRYESVAWLPVFILLCVQWAQTAKYFPEDTTFHELQGTTYLGLKLTYFAIIFGQATAWCTLTGDYCVHYPTKVNKFKVFTLTWVGLAVPTLFTSLLGIYVGGAIMTNTELGDLYATGGFGGVFVNTLHPRGWARFSGIIYGLAVLPNLAVEFYSSALSLQLFGSHFIAVPRFIWVSLVGSVTLILAVAGRNVFDHILQNLLPILGYWTICFGLTILIEHYVFRPRLGGYDLDGWCDPKRTPRGIAGTFTLLSCIGLSFLGMSQTWYTGPLAKMIGDYGGDVGDYIVVAVTILFYTLGRLVEIKVVGR